MQVLFRIKKKHSQVPPPQRKGDMWFDTVLSL